MEKYINFIGHKFGLLTVVSYAGIGDKLNLVCDCGNEKTARLSHLKFGSVKSCGCLLVSTPKVIHGKHLLSSTPEYAAWLGMIDRCHNPLHHAFPRYGGRGILVCDEWLDADSGFLQFLSDMGPRGSLKMSLERCQNDVGYSKNNCVWADKRTQANNRNSCVFLTHNGKTMSMMQWAGEMGLSKNTIAERLKRGWTVDRAISQPIRQFRAS